MSSNRRVPQAAAGHHLLDFARVERGVGLAHHFEDRSLRLRGVEIVIEGGSSCARLFRSRDCISTRASAKLPEVRRCRKFRNAPPRPRLA